MNKAQGFNFRKCFVAFTDDPCNPIIMLARKCGVQGSSFISYLPGSLPTLISNSQLIIDLNSYLTLYRYIPMMSIPLAIIRGNKLRNNYSVQ